MANKNWNTQTTNPREEIKKSGPASPLAGKMFSGSAPKFEDIKGGGNRKEPNMPKVSEEGKFEQI